MTKPYVLLKGPGFGKKDTSWSSERQGGHALHVTSCELQEVYTDWNAWIESGWHWHPKMSLIYRSI